MEQATKGMAIIGIERTMEGLEVFRGKGVIEENIRWGICSVVAIGCCD